MLGGIGNAHSGYRCQTLNAFFALSQRLNKFQTVWLAKRLGNHGKLVEQNSFGIFSYHLTSVHIK